MSERGSSLSEEVRGHTPGPWEECGRHRGGCVCGYVWSRAADMPVAKVIEGVWGDEYPAIRVPEPGAINASAEPYMEMVEYGEVPTEIARANARLIAAAPTMYDALRQIEAGAYANNKLAGDIARAALRALATHSDSETNPEAPRDA